MQQKIVMQQESGLAAIKSFGAVNNAVAQNFRMDNGVEGAGRVERTPTGFKTVVHGYGTPEEVLLEIKREVDLEGNPYLEIELTGLDEEAKKKVMQQLEYGFIAAGHKEEVLG